MKKYLLSLLVLSTSLTYAQKAVYDNQTVIELKNLAAQFRAQQEANKEKAIAIAQAEGRPLKEVSKNGEIMEIQGVSATGELIYYITDNLDAARTVSTDKVWPGGILGLNLSGGTVKVGEWDGGAVRTSHRELVGRVTQADAATTLSNHATHVAGTMVGAGVDASAKGMAYTALLDAYDWNFDNSEMTTAAANGLLVSNHSYGTITGWRYNSNLTRWEWWGDTTISATEDYKFGYYNATARAWDVIAKNAPFYLIVKSAGNDRGDNHNGAHFLPNHGVTSSASRPDDGGTSGYDCISTSGNAKNILTIGAVNAIPAGYSTPSDVVMSSFSGWGPTDDGRIKPDIVANGVGVYSSLAGNDSAYASYNGTSMSSPNTSGSLVLIQQHYNDLNSNYMLAATLKALVIHTADEAGGSEGPDYSFGWGLLNTASAVQHISNPNSRDEIYENTLNNNQTFDLTLTSDGLSPLKATIVWADDPGTSPTPSLDPTTSMLVNDLDLRIIRNSNSTTFSPYILNPASPASAATRGDNFRDNVEQVFINTPVAGTYTVRVTHKGSLASPQNYSLITSGGIEQPDTLNCTQVTTVFPYSEDFESFTVCSNTPGSTCTLPSLSGWQNSTNDSIDWTVYNGGTPTASTGPANDFNPGTASGKYLYLEATGVGNPGKEAILISPCFDLDLIADPEFSFAYHMDGSDMGSISVDVNAGVSWTNVWFLSGDQASGWQKAVVDLKAYSGDTIQIRIRGRTGSGELSDMAIDDIELKDNPLSCNLTISSFPYTEDFETFNNCSTTPGAPCSMPVSSGYMNEASSDDVDWTTDNGGTTSGGTGPSADYDPGTAGGKYLYVEATATAGNPLKEAILYGPCFDLSTMNNTELSFAYHMYGASMGYLYVDVDTGAGWSNEWFINGNQGDQWNVAQIDLSHYDGKAMQIRFRGITGTGYESDIAIDALRVGGPTPRVYCGSGATSTIDSHVSNVTLESINNSTTSICAGYTDFTNMYANLERDSTYTLSVTTGDCDGGTAYQHGVGVYIDWNNDGNFNAVGETVLITAIAPATTNSIAVTVPSTAVLDSVRMRVVCSETAPIEPCGNYNYGETEEYTVIITSGPENDLCTGAIALTCNNTISGSTSEASFDGSVSTCGTSITAPGVWYKVDGNGQSITVDVCGAGTNYDTKLNVFSGTCGALTCVTGNDNSCGSSSQVNWLSSYGTTYYVLVQGASGQAGDFDITMQSSPSSAITTNTQTTFCDGGSVVLNSDTASSYQWFRNNALIGGATGKSFSASTSGDYRVLVSGPNGCTDTTAVATTVTVNPLPTVSISTSGANTFCDGDNVTLTSTSGNNYQWYRNGSLIGSATGMQYTASTSGIYNVIMEDANNCSDSSSVAVQVTVNPLPVVNLTAGGSTTFCDGDSVTLNTITGAAHQWYRNGNPIASSNTQSFEAKLPGQYNVEVTDGNTCQDSANSGITVNVNALPTVNIISLTPTTFCQNDSVSLSVSPSGTYQWYNNGVAITNATQSSITIFNSGSYNAEVTDGNSCVDSSSNATTVTVNPLPVVPAANLGDSVFCENDSTTLSSGPGFSYQWMKDGAVIPGATSIQYVAKSSGVYAVEGTDGNGCVNISASGVSVHVDTLPTVTFAPISSLCNTITSYTLIEGLPFGGTYNGPSVTNDSIFDPNAARVGVHTIVYSYTEQATGCSNDATSSVEVVNCVGIEEQSNSKSLIIYPNPANDLLHIQLNPENDIEQLTLTNVEGKMVRMISSLNETQKQAVIVLEIGDLSAGMYFLQAISASNREVYKLMIQR